ncbi:MAG: hypothetical protein KBD76_02725 [Bacteriovorax sp.]|nr:hypothetical protein [Bacteriovorax sp.]
MPQDERFFRQIFSGELSPVTKPLEEKKYSYYVHTPYYALDLNNDKNPEDLVYVKKENEDWIEIFENIKGEKRKIFGYRFEAKGYNAELFRIEFKKLSDITSVLVMYYYEGLSRYTEMQGTSRIYVATIDNRDLMSLNVLKGPSVFEENRSLKGHYHLRNYQVSLSDLNNDGIKELIVKFRSISQVYVYEGSGKWKTFKN